MCILDQVEYSAAKKLGFAATTGTGEQLQLHTLIHKLSLLRTTWRWGCWQDVIPLGMILLAFNNKLIPGKLLKYWSHAQKWMCSAANCSLSYVAHPVFSEKGM